MLFLIQDLIQYSTQLSMLVTEVCTASVLLNFQLHGARYRGVLETFPVESKSTEGVKVGLKVSVFQVHYSIGSKWAQTYNT